MAMTDVSRVMVDTNVLVYAAIEDAPLHREAVDAIRRSARETTTCWLSRQILREFVATLTRPQSFSPPIARAAVLEQAREWESRFSIAEDGPQVTKILFNLLERIPAGGKQIHDANIVATMLAHGIPALLTANVADFDRFREVITVLPVPAK